MKLHVATKGNERRSKVKEKKKYLGVKKIWGDLRRRETGYKQKSYERKALKDVANIQIIKAILRQLLIPLQTKDKMAHIKRRGTELVTNY